MKKKKLTMNGDYAETCKCNFVEKVIIFVTNIITRSESKVVFFL